MRKFDSIGLALCDLQGEVFELSAQLENVSTEIFVRRFVYSSVAKMFDDTSILYTDRTSADIVAMVEEEYQNAECGTVKYDKEELYWIGYFYRYFAYTYDLGAGMLGNSLPR